MGAHESYVEQRERLEREALATIERLFTGVEFSELEQRFVAEAGLKLHEFVWELMQQWPQIGAIRPMVVMYALAAMLGGRWTFDGGIPKLRHASQEEPSADAE
jgi:hypothetical protein